MTDNYERAVNAAKTGYALEAIAFALLALVDEFRKPEPFDPFDPFGNPRDDEAVTACACGHPVHDGPCESTRDGQPDDGWTPMCPCRRAEPEHDQ